MANKLLKPKRGNVNNLPSLPIEDGSLIFAYDNNAPSSTILVDIGERRLALASSYSAHADDAGKLGGHTPDYFAPASSLNQFADKQAFTKLDPTTNNIVKLTRANGGTVQKIIDNVSHATSATISSTANLAKNSNALGGSSLSNIIDKINNSVAASDAMVYLGTVGNKSENPTITALPSTAKVGSAYKVVSDGTYAGIVAETGDLFIYASVGWTLIPSGDDGNVFIGDSKDSKFPYKTNNLVVATGDQKVTSIANVTATSGTITALGTSVTNLKAVSGTITNITGTLNGTAKNADTVDNFHAINSSALTSSQNSDKIVLAKNIVDYIDAQAFATTAQVQQSISWIEF